MADQVLRALVRDRVREHPPSVPGAAALVLAAFEGHAAVEDALGGETPLPPAGRPAAAEGAAMVPSVHLATIAVEGFRGVGAQAVCALEAGNGLTLIVGRNGSGKSSFSEALETVLTGSSARWSQRSKVWGEGWRNLHHDRTSVEATFAVEGRPSPLVLTRSWAQGAALDASTFTVDGRAGTLDSMGWTRLLALHRPLLSHNELGRILDDGPTKLYDALASLLGLEDLTTAQLALGEVRRGTESVIKQTEEMAARLRDQMVGLDDERAVAAAAALAAKLWDLDSVDRALGAGLVDVEERSVLTRLRALATVPVTDFDEVRRVSARLRELDHELGRLGGSSAAVARDTAALLEQALRVHGGQESRDCPVCGTGDVITFEWRLRTTDRIRSLREQAAAADAVHRRVDHERAVVRALLHPAPKCLTDVPEVGIDTARAFAAWITWAQPPEGADAAGLATHLERNGPELVAAVAELRRNARIALDRREEAWRPVAAELAEWLPKARRIRSRRTQVRTLRAAEEWLRSAHNAIRDQRFSPIVEQVQQNWTELRQDSNVSLGALRLEGSGNRRQLKLDATVDGEGSPALGVMSQGELNCLALSLFLPRASMPESPFQFLVIDDPVQAMDPSKVEGLARVLHRAAATRQVVVFTHDDRLPEAARHLDLPVTVIEVTRRHRSVVELRRVLDPIRRYIDDALALAASGLPGEVAVRVIPGYCRNAVEAACAVAVRRRLRVGGATHADVERKLVAPTTLLGWVALWRLDDPSRAGDVLKSLNNSGWSREADALTSCNRGAHGAPGEDQRQLVRAIESLCARIVAGNDAAD